jgi:hypothetical protein
MDGLHGDALGQATDRYKELERLRDLSRLKTMTALVAVNATALLQMSFHRWHKFAINQQAEKVAEELARLGNDHSAKRQALEKSLDTMLAGDAMGLAHALIHHWHRLALHERMERAKAHGVSERKFMCQRFAARALAVVEQLNRSSTSMTMQIFFRIWGQAMVEGRLLAAHTRRGGAADGAAMALAASETRALLALITRDWHKEVVRRHKAADAKRCEDLERQLAGLHAQRSGAAESAALCLAENDSKAFQHTTFVQWRDFCWRQQIEKAKQHIAMMKIQTKESAHRAAVQLLESSSSS